MTPVPDDHLFALNIAGRSPVEALRLVRAWRNHGLHRETQAQGRAFIFADYRLRVAGVMRDYGMDQRAEAQQAQ